MDGDAFDISKLPCGICQASSVDVVKFLEYPGRGGARCAEHKYTPTSEHTDHG